MSKSFTMALWVAASLVTAVREHGAPNSFAFSELVGYADAMNAGRAVRAHWKAFVEAVHICVDVRVNLSGGRLHVEAPL
jgi:hypothetical protein